MNLYFCTGDLHEAGLYVAAESRGKAKRMYCDYCDSLMDFIMIRTYIMCHDFKAPRACTMRTAKLWKPQECGIERRIKE